MRSNNADVPHGSNDCHHKPPLEAKLVVSRLSGPADETDTPADEADLSEDSSDDGYVPDFRKFDAMSSGDSDRSSEVDDQSDIDSECTIVVNTVRKTFS